MQTQESPPPQTNEQLGHKQLKAMAKASRPWYLKKRFWLLGAVGLIAIGTMIGGGRTDKDNASNAAPTGAATEGTKAGETKLFAGRVDAQREDKERNIGQSVEISGYTATVTAGAFQQSLNEFQKDGYVVADVTIANRDDRAQAYNLFDWKLQTPAGQVIDPTFSTDSGMLGSGDLVKGGSVAGSTTFKVGTEKGSFYIIYKPDAFDSARGIWKVTR